MNFEEFKQQVMEDLPGALPERLSNVEIEPVSVTKLQHGSYDGITIREEGSNIGMNLDLSGLFERMEKGTAYDEVLAEAVAIISNATAQAPKIDVDRLMDYEQLKETLSIQVVPTASNEEMLQNIPHKEMEDLSMVYRFVVGQDESGTQTILVTNKLLEQYGITEDQLHEDAMENAPVFKPVQIRSMTEVLAEMMGADFAEDMGLPTPDVGDMMYVASTPGGSFGAGVITYPEFMDQAAEKVGGDFYVLPSSVHEVLIVPDKGERSCAELENMVKEVNSTQVDIQDQLSDKVYHYDSKEHIFELAEKYEKRVFDKEIDAEKSVVKDLKDKAKEASKAVKKDVIEHPKTKGGEAL